MNFYEYLNIKETATTEEIRTAFRKLAKRKHPDHNKADNAFWEMVELNLVRDTLLNPQKRADYDRSLHAPANNASNSVEESPTTKKSNIYHKVRSFFTYRCQICGIELSSTWRGYCLYHYLEATNQLYNKDFVFEYAGQLYQWANPPEHLKNQKSDTPSTRAGSTQLSPVHIALYGIMLLFILLVILSVIPDLIRNLSR